MTCLLYQDGFEPSSLVPQTNGLTTNLLVVCISLNHFI